MSFDGVDTRKHPRHPYSNNIEFCLDASSDCIGLHGLSVDISDSGICLYTFTPIYAGQTITFETTLPVPYQKATVIWVQKRAEDLYRAGLKFITVSTEPATEGIRDSQPL